MVSSCAKVILDMAPHSRSICRQSSQSKKAVKTPLGQTPPEGGAETILVVDDEESLRLMVGRILRTAGYTVLTARDGEEALDLYKRGPAKISLVILDLMMPKMGGQQCLEELLRIDPKAKILISTGVSPGDEQTKLVIDSRSSGFIHKPFDNTQLLSVVRTLSG